MLKSKSRWMVVENNSQIADELVDELQLAPLVAKLLVNRGIKTVDLAKDFLFTEKDFYDPFLLNDMDLCIERIQQAIRNQEKIMVFGDYDADGVTSTYVLLSTLREVGANADYYIPNRFTEGYGPNEAAFRFIKEQGYDLIITVDNGISAIHEAQVAKEIGLDLIITDHHEPGPELPEAIAIIHPKRKDSHYPFDDLAGVGVAFKLSHALLGKVPEHLLPFVAIGTVGDLVPLQDENRLIVKKGLALFSSVTNFGLKALMKITGVETEKVDEENIGFGLAPRINAPGRLDHAGIAVDLFLTETQAEAEEIAQEINEINIKRQSIVDTIAQEAVDEFSSSPYKDDKVIIIGKAGWNPGVIGIVASRLVEAFQRPTICLSYDLDSGIAKGSARSIPKFNMFENLAESRDILPHFGGHPMAAGMTLKIEDVDRLRERLNTLANEQLQPDDFIPMTEIDVSVSLDDVSLSAIEQMDLLRPFGTSNPKPKILIENINISSIRTVGADHKHLKVTFSNDASTLDGIGFRLGSLKDEISPLSSVSVIGELGINEWNNTRKPQIYVKDLAIHEWQLFDFRGHRKLQQWNDKLPLTNRKFIVFQEETIEKVGLAPYIEEVELLQTIEEASQCLINSQNIILVDLPPSPQFIEALLKNTTVSRIYAHFYQDETQFLSPIPSRDQFKWYYAFLFKKGVFDIRRNCNDLAKYRGITRETIYFMTKVFFELDFVTIENGIVTVSKQPQKRDLSESISYQQKINHMKLEKELLFSTQEQLKQWLDQFMNTTSVEEEKNIWI